MAKRFKVVLEFHYDSDEDISEWNAEVPFKKVRTTEQAVQLAIAELEANSPNEFEYKAEEL